MVVLPKALCYGTAGILPTANYIEKTRSLAFHLLRFSQVAASSYERFAGRAGRHSAPVLATDATGKPCGS